MTMTLDRTQNRFGPSLNFDFSALAQPLAFSTPWPASPSPPQPAPSCGGPSGDHQAFNPSMMVGQPPHGGQASTNSASSMASYGSMPVANTSAGSLSLRSMAHLNRTHSISSLDLLSINRMQTTSAAYGDQKFTTSASPVGTQVAPTSTAPYGAMGYSPAPVRPPPLTLAPNADLARRFSQQLVLPSSHA